MGMGLSEAYNLMKWRPLTVHLANDLSRTREQNGFRWGNYMTHWIFIAVKDFGPEGVHWRYAL